MKLRVAFVVILVCLSAVVFSCRRNQPSLVDTNVAPDTELWYSPPDSTEYEYLVHLYWRGVDPDGKAIRYIWTVTDTVVIGPLVWNPSERIDDFRRGRMTTRTDSVFAFTAFRNVAGVGLKKNRQAFHVAAIDDNGVIDPTPAAVEFVATVGQLPRVVFHTTVTRVGQMSSTTITKPYDPAVIDTVGMFRPFAIFYEGFTTNGQVREYRFKPLTSNVTVPGDDVWTPVNQTRLSDSTSVTQTTLPVGSVEGLYVGNILRLEDELVMVKGINAGAKTLSVVRGYGNTTAAAHMQLVGLTIVGRYYANEDNNPAFPDAQALPSGFYRVVAQCRDDAGAESPIQAGQLGDGVAQVVVNFEPDTEIFHVLNTYFKGVTSFTDSVDFRDALRDTVPYRSWVTLFYRGSDNPFDSTLVGSEPTCGTVEGLSDDINKCLTYQINYTTSSAFGSGTTSRWLPDQPKDSNPFGTSDSTSINVGTHNYRFRARTVDEFGKADGTPDFVIVYGNFSPTMDSFGIENFDGTVIGDGDTLSWDWWNPANYNGSFLDTVDVTTGEVVKEFYFTIKATGHDHPKDPVGSGVKSWKYEFRRKDDPSIFARFVQAGSWTLGTPLNNLADVFGVTFRYPFSPLADPPTWIEAFNNRPGYLDKDYDMTIQGRDAAIGEEFEQKVIIGGGRTVLGRIDVSTISRRTQANEMSFHFVLTTD